MHIQKDQLWKSAFRLLMQQFVGFFFSDQYDEVDWTKEVVFLDKELSTILLNSRPKPNCRCFGDAHLEKW